MHVANLRAHPEFIPTLASWHHGQWGELNPLRTLESRIDALRNHLRGDPIPVTFVALVDGAPVGSASLVEHDLATRPQLSPWLASVYVAPEQRHREIGRTLVRRVVAEAARIGVEKLYLFTLDREPFYAAMGWSLVEHSEFRERPISIMAIEPGAATAARTA